jgi:ABC-type transport system involved in multi-copper enzyme maturation permease subunit
MPEAAGRLPFAGPRAWVADVKRLTDNPVLVKEFRTRMRGSRAYILLLTYTALMTLVLGITYLQFLSTRPASPGYSGYENGWAVGRQIYVCVFTLQAVLIALITPALTAGAITLEREQRAYEMLVITRLSPWDVVVGKLVAALAFVILLLTSSLPLLSLSFFFGGVSPAELFFTYLSLALAAFVYGALGLLWSSIVPGTPAATVLTYSSVFAIAIMTAFPGAVPDSSGFVFRSINPIAAVWHAVDGEVFFRWHIPSWLNAAILNALAGLLLTSLAARRLEQFVGASAARVRVVATLLWLATLLFLDGFLVGNTGVNWTAAATPRELSIALLGSALVVLGLVVPIFATGDFVIRPGEHPVMRFLKGMLPHRALHDDLPAGIPLVALWVTLALVMVPLSFALVGRTDLLPLARTIVPAGLVMIACVVATLGLGALYSVILPSRWAALTMTYLTLVALTLLPLLGLISWQSTLTGRASPALAWQFLYLVPSMAYTGLLDPTHFALNLPPMMLDRVPFWVVTTIAYFIVAFFSAGLCLIVLTSQSRRFARQASRPDLALERHGAAA